MYFFLKEPKSKNETLINLIYYLKHEGKNFKFSTGQKINPKDWDSENRLPKTKRGAGGIKNKHISSILNQYVDFLEVIIKEHESKNKPLKRKLLQERFSEKFKHKKKHSASNIEQMVNEFIKQKMNSGSRSDAWEKKYNAVRDKLVYYELKKGKINFEAIDQDWLDEYCGFMRKINHKRFKPHNDNTLHRNIVFLFTFLNWAKGKYHNQDYTDIKNPIKRYQPDDVYLTEKEVQKLESLELEKEHLSRCRDLFLIGVYSGQRFSDYSVFEKPDIQGGMIIKRAEKTEHESFIPLHPKLKNLLDKYEWKLPKISGQKFNKNIQNICGKAGIEEKIKETTYRGNEKIVLYHKKCDMVTSHTARRTFITLSAEKGMPDHLIMKITGIRDPKTLTKYKKTSQNAVKEAMDKYWG